MSESAGSTDGQGNGEAPLGEALNSDTEPAADEGATDAGATDVGATDAGATDAGAASAGAASAGAADVGAASAGAADAGAASAGAAAAGAAEAGATEAGSGGTNGDGTTEAGSRAARRARNRKRVIGLTAAALAIETAWLRQQGYGVGGNVIVRCRRGHLFTTIWIPGVSVKSARLGFWRVQYCPVGKHWSLVTPPKRSDLSARELRAAGRHRDIRIP